jgi:cytochrome c oxidase assembly protein subunit 11
MVFLCIISVPLYAMFCRVTGYAGSVKSTMQKSDGKIGEKFVTIHFDSNVAKKLPWKFRPKQNKVTIKSGQTVLTYFEAHNNSMEDILGIAVYNVTPHRAGQYFNKIQCFCFEEQLLKAGEKMDMPVLFYLDSAVEQDPDLQDLETITLSYTFFRVKDFNNQ